jgi:CubicO group peptidase (beta-lactamase class C family)
VTIGGATRSEPAPGAGATAAPDVAAAAPDPGRLAAVIRTIDELADTFLTAPRVGGRAVGRVPGYAYGVVVGGALVHARGIGTIRIAPDGLSVEGGAPDVDTVFRIASMTKSFTAAAILRLRDDGALGLDDPVARHLPDLAGIELPTRDSPALTIRHLLTMAGGLPTDDPWGDRQQGLPFDRFADLLRGGLSFAWTPGIRFDYSNLGYGILGRVVRNVAGVEYREFVRERLLTPLGMSSTTYLEAEVPADRLARGYLWRDDRYIPEPIDGYGALSSMGGVFTSVRDLARWVSFFADAYPPRDAPDGAPLSRASRREMQDVQRAFEPAIGGGVDGTVGLVEAGYGFGLFAYDDMRFGRVVGHSGGYPGYGSDMRWHPASGIGVIVLGNARYAPSNPLARELLGALLAADLAPVRAPAPAPAALDARDTVESLLARWDDATAARSFAMNMELDEPLERRRAAVEKLRDVHGSLVRDADAEVEVVSPLEIGWWLRGERGRVHAEVLLTPEARPRIQSLRLASVAEPSPVLADAARTIAAALARWDADLPPGLRLAETVDRERVRRDARTIAARFAPLTLGPVVAGDGSRSATWRLSSERGPVDLTITTGADGTLESVTFAPLPATAPPARPRSATLGY